MVLCWLGRRCACWWLLCMRMSPAMAHVLVCVRVLAALQMSMKQAGAYWATSDERYANNALGIIEAWTNTNQQFGLQKENGESRSHAAALSLPSSTKLGSSSSSAPAAP